MRKIAAGLLAIILSSPTAAHAETGTEGFPTGLARKAGNADLQMIRLPDAEMAHPAVTSAGVAVAVIDDGIDRDHEYFSRSDGSSRVVAEACFMVRCPNGSDTQFGTGAAAPSLTVSGHPNSHGTLVAGAAAGRLRRTPTGYEPSRGVAAGADIVAIRVFPDDIDENGARWSDIRRALEWVADNAGRYRIVSVNMSFGSGAYPSDCGNVYPEFAALIDRLLAAGVTPVAATGNDGRTDAVMVPACLPGVVGVGSLDGDGRGVAYSSNSGPGTDILAPGRYVISAMAGRGVNGEHLYASASGTSLAAPHVSGTVALLAASFPLAGRGAVTDAILAGAAGGIQGRSDLRKLDILGAVDRMAVTSTPLAGPPKPLTRLAGNDRYETAALASQHAYPQGADTVYLVSGRNFPDALIAGGLAASRPGPVLLTDHDLPASTLAEISRLQPQSVTILGGPGVVGDHIFDAVRTAAPTAGITRLAGNDRYETAALAAHGLDTAGTATVYLVSGRNFPDALIAGGLAASRPGPVLLTGSSLPTSVDQYLGGLGDYRVVVLGGAGAVSDAAAEAARS